MNEGRPAAMRALSGYPGLWLEALRAVVALVPRRWWRKPPFLPLPDRRYLAWRIATAYGRPDAPVASDDLVAFLRWRARQRRA